MNKKLKIIICILVLSFSIISCVSKEKVTFKKQQLSLEEIENYRQYYNKMYIQIDGVSHPVMNIFIGNHQTIINADIDNFLQYYMADFYIPATMDEQERYIYIQGNPDNTSVIMTYDYYRKDQNDELKRITTHVNAAVEPEISTLFDKEFTEVVEMKISTTLINPAKLVETNTLPLEKKDTVKIDIVLNEYGALGTGITHFTLISNTEIAISGSLGLATYVALEKLLEKNPFIDTLIFTKVIGSIDDTINVETGRLIRKHGLNTKVNADSHISSGGVDLFASGVERIYTSGAILGVHAWCCGPRGESAHELPRNHENHFRQLTYFSEMLPETGEDFYFFTLESANYDDMHEMTKKEIQTYKLATQFIEE